MRSDPIPLDTLRALPLFHGLNETECRQLAEISEVVSVPSEKVIMRQGENCQNLWILLAGTCEVSRQDGPSEDGFVLATLGEGSVFGEMSFFHKATHSATVRATVDSQLMRIGRRDFDELIQDNALAAYKLAFNAVASLADRLRRMDKWVTRLTAGSQADAKEAVASQPSASQTDEHADEWNQFRERMFTSWNL